MFLDDSPSQQGKRIKTLRKKLNFSRSTFAKRQSDYVNVSTLQALEEGRYKKGISYNNAQSLEKAFYNEGLVVNVEWIIRGNGTPPKFLSAIKLEETRSVKRTSEGEVLRATQRNAEIMKFNFALVKAIKKNELTRIKIIITQGANAHLLKEKGLYIISGSQQNTILHIAAEFSSFRVVDYIISELRIHPDIRNRQSDASAHRACYSNNIHALHALQSFDADLDAGSREGATPLIWACYMGNYECAEVLIDLNVKINKTDYYGNTAAHWAAYNNQPKILELLYQKGALMFEMNHDGLIPLDWACNNGQYDSVKFLLSIQ